jgi:hypothetical protein
VVGVLWGIEPFSHKNHHIRVYMHHVCLIQSISAHNAIHKKLGTCSGSSQCQLHFGTKIVPIVWGGCEWLPSEYKMHIFRQFLCCPPLEVYFCKIFWPQGGLLPPSSCKHEPGRPPRIVKLLKKNYRTLVACQSSFQVLVLCVCAQLAQLVLASQSFQNLVHALSLLIPTALPLAHAPKFIKNN